MSNLTLLLRHSGDIQFHVLYMSLGNINKDIWSCIGEGAWVLVAYIPKLNWQKTLDEIGPLSNVEHGQVVSTLNWHLFHRCMEIITRPFRHTTLHLVTDPDSYTCLVQYELAAYSADLEEQYNIAVIAWTMCPQCLAKGKVLGQGCHHLRSSKQILQNIRAAKEEFININGQIPDWWEFLRVGKGYNLCGVNKPVW
jgi:hypothetical protein